MDVADARMSGSTHGKTVLPVRLSAGCVIKGNVALEKVPMTFHRLKERKEGRPCFFFWGGVNSDEAQNEWI